MNERKCVYAFFLLEWLYHSKLEAGRLKVDEQIDRFDYFSFSFHKFSHSYISCLWMENLQMFLITRKLNFLIFMFIQKYTSHSYFFSFYSWSCLHWALIIYTFCFLPELIVHCVLCLPIFFHLPKKLVLLHLRSSM